MTFWNFRASALIGSMISSPPATARLPPGRKSYCTSTTTSASSTLNRIVAARYLAADDDEAGGASLDEAGAGAPVRSALHSSKVYLALAPLPPTTAVTSVTRSV